MTGSEKKNLAAGIREMRSVAIRLTQWADDLEKYASEGTPSDASRHLSAASIGATVHRTDRLFQLTSAPTRIPPPAVVEASPLKGEACSGTASTEPAPTLTEVITFLPDVCAAGYSGQVKKLLASFGADIVSEVPEEKFGELMAKARELGEAGDGDAG